MEKIGVPKPYPMQGYSPICGCSYGKEPKYKEKCFFYEGVRDMCATIPYCNYFSKMENFSCKDCGKFISKVAAFEMVKEKVDSKNIND